MAFKITPFPHANQIYQTKSENDKQARLSIIHKSTSSLVLLIQEQCQGELIEWRLVMKANRLIDAPVNQ